MNLRRIKVLAVAVSSVGLVLFEVLRHLLIHPMSGYHGSHFDEHLISGISIVLAVGAFSWAMFRVLERLHDQLVALNKAAIAVTGDLSVDRVLERVAELAREVAGAPYASVQVRGDPPRTVSSGVTAGGPRLVLPVVVRGDQLGELVLSLPQGRRFRDTDRRALETFATQAGIALENARLYEQVHELAAIRERARIGMDLHDGVIQHLYGLGLALEDVADVAQAAPSEAATKLRESQASLIGVIGEIRSYVRGLRDEEGVTDLRAGLARLVAEFPRGVPSIVLDVPGQPRLAGPSAAHVLQIVREALANAIRHAEASRLTIRAGNANGTLVVTVEDDGRGFDPGRAGAGLGIRHMRERADWCGCRLDIDSAAGHGTRVRVSVPVRTGTEAAR